MKKSKFIRTLFTAALALVAGFQLSTARAATPGIGEGKATVLFRIGDDGEVKRVAEAAPLTPLLRYPGTVAEAAQSANIPKGLLPPEGGWETLLQGRDL